MDTNAQHYMETVRKHLDALKAHDAETRRLHAVAMTTGNIPEVGTFPAREATRRLLGARLETSVEMLLGVLS